MNRRRQLLCQRATPPLALLRGNSQFPLVSFCYRCLNIHSDVLFSAGGFIGSLVLLAFVLLAESFFAALRTSLQAVLLALVFSAKSFFAATLAALSLSSFSFFAAFSSRMCADLAFAISEAIA